MITREDLETKLAKHIISRTSHPHIPASLEGELLLEEDRDEGGDLKGVVSITIENLLNVNVAGKRLAEIPALEYAALKAFDPKNESGHHKYWDRWKAEGII